MNCRLCGGDQDALVVASWSLHLPLMAKSQNDLAANKGAKRFAYGKFRDEARLAVMIESRRRRVPPAARKRRVTVTRVYGPGQRQFDYGNLVGGIKPVLDALVLEKLLVNDTHQWVEEHYRQLGQFPGHPLFADVGIVVLLEEFA